jgi:acetyl esterase/lipase
VKHVSLLCSVTLGLLTLAAMVGTGCGSSSSSSGTTSTTTTLTASSTSTTTGTSITLTAEVSPTAATGTVTFYKGSTSLGTGTLSSGKATLSTSFSSAGTYSITAVYGGSSTYATSTSSAVSITVTSSSTTATTTTLTSSATTTTVGTDITLTATVASSPATGTVTFYEGSTSLGTGTLSSGTATLTTSFSTAGTYTLTATYDGDSTYASSTSSSITETVDSSSSSGSTTSTTSLSASPTTAYPGSLVVLTATVSPTAATGTVTFYEGSTSLGTATLSSGTATLNTHFSSTGTYKLTATYGGDSTYSSSTSSSVTETIESSSYSLDLSSYSCTSATTTVTTDSSHSVTYCLYSNVIYAANPVSTTYESMNIYVPTSVDGTAVSGKPILFENGVGGYMSSTAGSPGTNGNYALGKGYVVVEPGCRGRDNGSSGDYYGVAPAAMVDLKAAIRFLRYNYSLGTFTGDVSYIISSGGSAGGALSALLGASGNSSLYYSYLSAIGAADADDNIFAVGAWSPITNLDHADMSYEMEYSSLEYSGSIVNSTLSNALISEFDSYQDGLALTDKRGSLGTLTSSNITEYILEEYMEPSLYKYVEAGGTAPSYATCTSSACTFTFANYLTNSIGTRGKSAPAFDAFFDISSSSSYYDTVVNTTCPAETLEFGNASGSTSSYSGTNCNTGSPRHFTDFTSEAMDSTDISSSIQTTVNMMNPMYYLMNAISSSDSSGVAKYWYIRDGSIATDTSAYIIVNLATAAENLLGTGYVNASEDWGKGHNVNADPGGFSTWVTSSVAAD